MTRLRKAIAAAVLAVFAVGLSTADASVWPVAQKTKKTPPTTLQKVSSATSGFFKGVVDTVTLKKLRDTSKNKSTKK